MPYIYTLKNHGYRDSQNPLRGLNMPRLVGLQESGERGEYADLQWFYYYMERSDAMIHSVIQRRRAALLSLDWDVRIVSQEQDNPQAQEQADFLRMVYDSIDNFREAVSFLFTGFFRGFAHLEKHWTPGGLIERLEPVEQWFWVRDGLFGDWEYNAGAVSGHRRGETIKPENFITLETPALDRILSVLYLRKNLSQSDWDSFISVYGIPSIFLVGPPNADEAKQKEYQAVAEEILSNGRGFLPHDSDIKFVTGGGARPPFHDQIKYLDEQITIAATGGLLTMLAAPGSGTLAGNAHQDSFLQIAKSDAITLAGILQNAIDVPLLAEHFPGQPPMAYFEFSPGLNHATSQVVQDAIDLKTAGLDIDPAEYVWPVRGGSIDAASAVPKTGQTTSYRAGDDGDLETGVAWPNPRFTDLSDGTVKDNLTGLEWVKAPHSLSGNSGTTDWNTAIDFCNNLVLAGYSDWRLPTRKELTSLVDFGRYTPSLPVGHPFAGVQSDRYWSGTSDARIPDSAWNVSMFAGYVQSLNVSKVNSYYVWPVRSGSVSGSSSATGNITVDTRDSVLSVSINIPTLWGEGWVEGSSIIFNADASHASGSETYVWDMDGDGIYDDGTSPSVSKNFTEGLHVVSVEVRDGNNTAKASILVPVGKPPAVNEPDVKPAPDPLFGKVFELDGRTDFSFDADKKANGFLLIAHGLENSASDWWVTNMAAKIKERLVLEGKGEPNICLYDWEDWANPSKLDGEGLPLIIEAPLTLRDLLNDVALIKPSGLAHGVLLAHWLDAQIDTENIDPEAPVHLIGHSAGGFVVGGAGTLLTLPAGAIFHDLDSIQVTMLDTPWPSETHRLLYPSPGYLEQEMSSYYGLFNAVGIADNNHYKKLYQSRFGSSVWDIIRNGAAHFDDHREAYKWYTDTIQSSTEEGFFYSPLLDYGFYGFDRESAPLAMMADALAEPAIEDGATSFPLTGFSTFGDVAVAGGEYTITESANAGLYMTVEFPEHARSVQFQYKFSTLGDGDFLSVHVGPNRTVYIGANTELSRGGFLDAEADVREFAGTTNVVTFKLVSRGSPNAVLVVRNVELVCALDSDEDGLADDVESNSGYFISEYDTGTDPSCPNTDCDGVNDGSEVAAGTDPISFKASKGTYADKVRITWDAEDVPRDVSSYGVIRATNSCYEGFPDFYEELATTTELGYDDTSALPGKVYYYTIWSEKYQLMGEACGFRQVPPYPMIMTDSPLPSGVVGIAYNEDFIASGGVTPYVWSISAGSLPAGLSLSNSGVISGTPSAVTNANFTVRVTGGDSLSSTKDFSLSVIQGTATVAFFDMETDPGWTRQGEWAFGTPSGGGGTIHGYSDPASGATGTKVFGINLNGDYSTTVGGPFYLTMGPINLTGYSESRLRFKRWLNTDHSPFVFATIEVSSDGSNWTNIFTNPSNVDIKDNAWTPQTYTLGPTMDNMPAVYIRWGHHVGYSGAYAYSGWNIDDVEVLALSSDSDSDGLPDSWEMQYFTSLTNASPNAVCSNGINTLLQAYIAGLDPNDPQSGFRTSVLYSPHSERILQWTTVSGRVYNVYWTPSLMQPFQPLKIGIQYPQNSYTDTLHSAESSGFYRVVVMLFDYDADGDGLPNDWEAQYAVADAYGHSDSDGFNNLEEFIAGTDPTNSSSFFTTASSVTELNGTNCFVVEWISIPDRFYSVQWSTNLSSGFQTLETGIEHPQNTFTDTVHQTDGKGFYKIDVRMDE